MRNVTFIFFVNSDAMLSKYSAMKFYNMKVKYIISVVHKRQAPCRRGYYVLNNGDYFFFFAMALNVLDFLYVTWPVFCQLEF